MIAKEIEKGKVPVAFITAMSMLGKQAGANRVVMGTKLIHPCGDPNMSPEADLALRQKIVKTALNALQTDVGGPTVFIPDIVFTSG